jgi:hypothetical protein
MYTLSLKINMYLTAYEKENGSNVLRANLE